MAIDHARDAGDVAWKRTLAMHDDVVRNVLAGFGGREIDREELFRDSHLSSNLLADTRGRVALSDWRALVKRTMVLTGDPGLGIHIASTAPEGVLQIVGQLAVPAGPPPPRYGLIGENPSMLSVREDVGRVADLEVPVLLRGETGTGKELVARAVHDASPRRSAPFVAVNLASLTPSLSSSQLFGAVKGAFTGSVASQEGFFRRAHGGTLFLDEIGDLSRHVQVKLLRVLQEGEIERLGGGGRAIPIDIRLIAATNVDLGRAVRDGRFREDLYYRLNVVPIHLPPLRERREDIPRLAKQFLATHVSRYRKAITGFDPAALQALVEHRWPGNVRELDHAIERAVLMAGGNVIHSGDLWLRRPDDGNLADRLDELSLEQVEGFLIQKAMARYGTVSHAAKALGLSRSALYRRLERHRPS